MQNIQMQVNYENFISFECSEDNKNTRVSHGQPLILSIICPTTEMLMSDYESDYSCMNSL